MVLTGADSIPEALEQIVMAMFEYISPNCQMTVRQTEPFQINVSGHDLQRLVFALMDEFLFKFSVDLLLIGKVEITSLRYADSQFHLTATGYGEPWCAERHESGTEVKAITYSNMQINLRELTEEALCERISDPSNHLDALKTHTDIYVIVDI